VPDSEQRLWRTLTRTKHQRRRDRGRLHNQLEALLEEAHLKLSGLVSDLLGAGARRMLKALADGETDPSAIAALGDQRLHATPAQLRDALGACTELNPVYRRLVKMTLEDVEFVEQQISQLDQEIASLLHEHQEAVARLAEVPGLGVDSAQQIIAEAGVKAAAFASAEKLASWGGACPGDEESAGVNRSRGGRPRETARCAAFSMKRPMLLSNIKGVSSRSSIGGWCPAWDTTKPSERLHIASVV
jgi:transposase